MGVKDLVTAISSVGFPIVAFFVCIWFLKYVYDSNNAREKEHSDSILALANAVNENTRTLTMLYEKVNNEK